jgi:hypothetical protein
MSDHIKQEGLRLPIACNLQEPETVFEREREVAEIFSAAGRVRELDDGYAFEFPGDDAWAARLAEFVLFERKCCPFFTFELVFDAGQHNVWLRLRGGEGVKDFIRDGLHVIQTKTV